MNAILEQSSPINYALKVQQAATLNDIAALFNELFGISTQPDPDNYKDGNSDYGLKVRGVKAREKINEQCREIIARVEKPEDLTAEERAILLQYSGRGGLTENSQYEYYTPAFVAEGVWEAMHANGFVNGNVLDPCCGAGVFEGTKPAGVLVTANDLDPVGSKVAALLNPQDKISTEPFESVAIATPDDTFDSCISNVPFGDARGKSAHIDPAYKNEKLIERYFILRILNKIKPGGLACLVVPTNIVGAKGKKWTEFRIAVSKMAEFLGAHKLPSKTFGGKGGQGTDTVTDVIVLRKHSRELLGKIESTTIEDLRTANVVWNEFIEGKYWQGEGKKFIMGKYIPKVPGDRWSREAVDGDIDSESIKRKLAQKFHSRIDWELLDLTEPVIRAYANGDRKVINGVMHEFMDGNWNKIIENTEETILDAQKYGANSIEALRSLLASPKGALAITAKQAFAIFKSYPDALLPLQKEAIEFAMSQPRVELCEQIYRGSIIGSMIARMSSKNDAGEDIENERLELQELITKEIERFGHPKNNKGLVLAGEGSRTFGMFKNAVDINGHFSDLLSGKLEKSESGMKYDAADVSDIVSHLFVREGQEDIFIEDIQELYSGTAKIETLGDLAEVENIAITPDGRIMPVNRYCAGEVYEKAKDMAAAMQETDDERLKAKFRKQLELINQKRTITKSEDIVFGFRHKWFSRKYVVEFLRENGYRSLDFGSIQEVEREQYDGSLEKVNEFVTDFENENGEFSGLPDTGFYKQFQKYLNGGKITSSKTEIKAEYIEQVNSLERQFNVWMQQHPDLPELTEKFNRQFNSYVPFEYEGTSLGIEEMLSGEITPHTYQNAEVRRLSEQGSGICGFGVGLGKSFTALATAAYNYKRGRAKRTCIVVPSSVLENWYHEARQFYNEEYLRGNTFFVGLEPKFDKDGNVQQKPVLDENGQPRTGKNGEPLMQDIVRFTNSKENIHEAMWKIPQSNFSLVVMTKEKFASIPLRPATKRKFTDKMVQRQLMSEGLADDINNGKKSYKDDKHIANVENKFGNEGTKKANELPYLEDMGFDSIIVDEIHYAKNSFEPGKDSSGIAYLPTAPSSQIAIDMAIKSDYLRSRNNGRGVYGLSATPVTNSPFEIFNMLSLVMPLEEFERFGVKTVDDFVRVFGRIEQVNKVKVSGEVAEVPGLVGFQNLDGLRNIFHKYVNIKNVQDVDSEIHVPDAVENEENVEISEEQQVIYQQLKSAAKQAAKKKSKMIFSIIRDMDRLSTDIDMYNHTMTFVFNNRDRKSVEQLVADLPKEIAVERKDEEGQKYKETIPAFIEVSDMGPETFTLVISEELEEMALMRFPKFGLVEAEMGHPVTPKYAQMIENLRKHYEANGKQLVFTEEKSQHQKLKRIIVHHLPVTAEQIGIINADDAKGAALDKISKDYNAGVLKIVIANKKAEVGVNLQKGTVAIHHLTLPWTPASIKQRNGRGVRQGNKVDSVDIYYYCGKGTFDAYRKDLLKAKSNWIDDLLNGEDTSMENGDVTGMDELLDMLADNPEEAKKQRAERLAAAQAKKEENYRLSLVNKFQVLASIQQNLDSHESRKALKKADLESQIAKLEKTVEKYKALTALASDEEAARVAKERQASANRRLDEARAKLEGLDAVFEREREKLENNKKMTCGILRQAQRDGKLPFSPELIDNPGNGVVSTKGELFCVGDMYEESSDNIIFKIIAVDAASRRITIKSLLSDYEKDVDLAQMPPVTKVSYSETELALKKVLSEQLYYHKLPTYGIDKKIFLDHLSEMNIDTWAGAVYIHNGKYVAVFSRYDEIPEGAALVWPEPENEEFKKAVCTDYLKKAKGHFNNPGNTLMKSLFGANYDAVALEYGNKGTDAEILAKINESWELYLEEHFVETTQAKLNACSYYGISDALCKKALEQYDNTTDITRLCEDFLQGLKTKLQTQIAEEEAEAERLEMEKLRSNPNFKEIPQSLQEKFNKLGITVKTNTKDCHLPGFKGRNGLDYDAFERWFMQDKNGKMGSLYKMREILKSRYRASFTDKWSEFEGAWWHIPATTDLNDVYELLA